ncbi:MAG: ribbon-helix-helix protein, CopG family [Acidilobaceae archaeon]
MRVVSFKVEEDLLELLEEYSRKRNIAKSEIIRRALRNYIIKGKNVEEPIITKRLKIID